MSSRMLDTVESAGEGESTSEGSFSQSAKATPKARSPRRETGISAGSWLRQSNHTAPKPPRGQSNLDQSVSTGSSGSRANASINAPADLEQKFEDEFTRHLKKSNKNVKWAMTGIGAGIGGVLALAAAPLTIPAVVAAAAAGGAGGSLLGKHRGEKRLQLHSRSSTEQLAASQRPTLRRLRYLVKWGTWQLLEYETASGEWRGAVVEEVVRAFSPWVQAMFLLRARAAKGVDEDDTEAQEIFQHLAPIYHWLQRSSVHQAVVGIARAVDAAFEGGSAHTGHAEICRVVFPTILETISIMDRLAPSTQAKLREDRALSIAMDDQAAQRTSELLKKQRRKRLREIVDSIRQVLERVEVKDVLAGRIKLSHLVMQQTQAVDDDDDDDAAPADSSAGATNLGVPLVVPPEGVEEVDGDSHSSDGNSSDDDFQSCGNASDAEADSELAGFTPARRGASRNFSRASSGPTSPLKNGPGSSNVGGPRPAKLLRRMPALPRGPGDHRWDRFCEAGFQVRSASYLKDRKKAPSGPSMLDLVSTDLVLIGPEGPVWHPATHRDFYPLHHKRSGDKRFLFIQNWIIDPYQAVIVAALDPHAPWLLDNTSPQAQVWQRFLDMSQEEQKDAFKVILSVEDGPWLLKRAVPKKPVLVGKQLKMHSRHEPGEYLEITLDVSSGSNAEKAVVGMVMRGLKKLKLALAVLIEGKTEEELPETLLVSLFAQNLDVMNLFCPDESLE